MIHGTMFPGKVVHTSPALKVFPSPPCASLLSLPNTPCMSKISVLSNLSLEIGNPTLPTASLVSPYWHLIAYVFPKVPVNMLFPIQLAKTFHRKTQTPAPGVLGFCHNLRRWGIIRCLSSILPPPPPRAFPNDSASFN